MNIIYEREDELYHHGIPGMKWYKRRFQNEDGSYTALGKLRYGIGSKGRETANMMSDWSKRMTSKEASNASKMHATTSGTKYFDNPHMLYNNNARKASRSLLDEYARAAWQNGQSMARMSKPSMQYAKDRMRTIARSINGNDAARIIAARTQYPGDKIRDRSDNLSQYMHNFTNRNPEQGEKAREKAFTPVMSKTDNAKLYLEGAKNLAGNYARYAKEGASQLPDRMRKGLATAGLAAGLQTGIAGRTVYDSVNAGARAARNTAMRGADEAKKYTGAMGEIMRAYGKNLKDKATAADVYGTALAKGLKSRGQEAASTVAGEARGYANAIGNFAKGWGNEIKGNANSAAARYLFNANKRPGTGDPGEDRDKLDPNARSGYDKRVANALGWANARRQAAAQAESDARAKHDAEVRAGVKADIAKYKNQMMDDLHAMSTMSRGDSVKASQFMERSGYGGSLPYTLKFGNESVAINPVKELREYNNPTTPNSGSKDASKHGSKDDRMLAYQEGVNSILGRSGETSAFRRMKDLESQMNAYRDNQARAKAATSDDPEIKALSRNNKVQGEHTNYFGRDLRRITEEMNRRNWDYNQGEERSKRFQRDYNKAEQFAKEHTPKHWREIGHIDQDLLRAKMGEIQGERDDYERRNTKIPDWIKREYGSSKASIPDYLWEELKKRR